MFSGRTTSSESITSSTSRAPNASAASRPAIAARYSASLLVARPMRRGAGGGPPPAAGGAGAGPGGVHPVPAAFGLRGLLVGAALPLRHHFLRGELLAGDLQAEGAQFLLVDAAARGGGPVLLPPPVQPAHLFAQRLAL